MAEALVAALMSFGGTAAVEASPPVSPARPFARGIEEDGRLRLLDVPFIPQRKDLCGGAALAMVLRYWGRTAIAAEDFGRLVEPKEGGIPAGRLADAVRALGWTTISVSGGAADVGDQLAQGRPVIALVRMRPGSYHYVVLVSWKNGRVVYHDPNVGPFRVMEEARFERKWSPAGRWALVILPPSGPLEPVEHGGGDSTRVAPGSDAGGCEAIVSAGILLAQNGDTAGADLRFREAQSRCPRSAAPLRERAGLRFRAEDWDGACRLAEQALALEPGDPYSWRLLAGSRYLKGDLEGALRAWNHVGEPKLDVAHIEGLGRIRYSAVTRQLGLPASGRLLTPGALRRAARRFSELPALSGSSLGLRRMPDGTAQVNAILLERPILFRGPEDVAIAGIGAVVDNELELDLASPTGNGELFTAGWRWARNRPRVSVGIRVPAAGGHPGIWSVNGFWERQVYATAAVADSGGSPKAAGGRGETVQEERRRTSLSWSDWIATDLRAEVGVALDEWKRDTAGSAAVPVVGGAPVDFATIAVNGGLEHRLARDRVALRAGLSRWVGLARSASFGTGELSLRWSSDGLDEYGRWQGWIGCSSATASAPIALWSGAGTGSGREPLLRAHPLLENGVVRGRVFGPTLAHGTIEKRATILDFGLVQIGGALFVDVARGGSPWEVDPGAGLRLRGMGSKSQVRIDLARGLRDGRVAVSIGYTASPRGNDR